ncbi:histidine kinase [Coraliomargarita sp. SDUM461003]|uniref:histidine kinase n=1 Tax=Thalassobacterium maritimum TaxID=3041265 RepID=A0ABU1AX22_9BACT|nr:histidine kinase [Coraliomargarita sp. SDUM461003]MDQ8207532.1 histidine kinase [Coraliomargarita sp. SDUM461003]
MSACASVVFAGGRSIAELETRKAEIEQELELLSRPSLRGGTGAIGFHSFPYSESENAFWLKVDLKETHRIHEVVLIPVLWRDMEEGFREDALPDELQVYAGTEDDPIGVLVAEYRTPVGRSPGITPIVLPVEETEASWVRIEGPRLSRRLFDNQYVFQMSEIAVFSGGVNVALRKPVTTSLKTARDPSGAWDISFLVDGITPYIMNSARGKQSVGYLGDFGATPELYLDMEEPQTITEIHLHAVEQSNTVPQAFIGDLGIPREFRIEGSETRDFENPVVLLYCHFSGISQMGPIMMWHIPPTQCRYVRIVTLESASSELAHGRETRIGFSEVELIADGVNVAEGKEVWTEPVMRSRRSPGALTDGHNYYGQILPTRAWLQELALRFDLETELAALRQELSRKYSRQEQLLFWMRWGLVVACFAVVFIVFYSRTLRIRHEARVRERIAANLHDELGANLHAIGMWSDIAQESVDAPDSLRESLQRIRGLTERTGASARLCSNMLEAEGVCEDLVDEMKREASRLLADIRYELKFEGEAAINRLSRRQRIDIFLFFKESLTNIIRHGQATGALIVLSVAKRDVTLTIADDGCGLSGGLPNSLQRRAKLMRAKAGVEHPEEGGTLVWLKLKAR